MKPFWKSMLVIFALGGGGGYYWWKTQSSAKGSGATSEKTAKKSDKAEGAKGKGAGRRGGGGPVSVRVVTVKLQDMPVVVDAVGTVEPEQSVVVRPQVNGALQAVLFKEGDYVKQGQLLFRIDQRPAKAAAEQVQAAVARDQAQLTQARAQEARLRPLMEKDYITRQEFDVAATQVKALEATSDANRAALEQAQLQLSYSQISAPISGRTGSLTVKAGNLLTAGNAPSPMVVINSTQPILVAISVPQRQLEDIRRVWNSPELKVQIKPTPAGPVLTEGQLVFMDNTINLQTGTILLKARVRNEKEILWPGQFITARIILSIEKNAVVLPDSAVQPGQSGPFVYIVRDGKATMQEIQVSRQIGDQVVVAKGLSGGEQVITDPPPALTADSQVNIRDPNAVEGKSERKGGKGGKGKGGEEAKSEKSAAAGKDGTKAAESTDK